MTVEPTRMLKSSNVLRIVWVPGTDRLRGVCHCGASHEDDDPTAMWDWLLAHPEGHRSESTDPTDRPTGPLGDTRSPERACQPVHA